MGAAGLTPAGFEIAWLEIADDPKSWRDVGFVVDEMGRCIVGTIEHRLTGNAGGATGIRGWGLVRAAGIGEDLPGLADLPDLADLAAIDGIPTTVVDRYESEPPADHPNGVFRIDHLVIRTPDTPRTAAALGEAGLQRRGHRDTNSAGEAVDMTFFWAGPVLLELAGPPQPKVGGGPARLGGLAFATERLDELVDQLGDRVSKPRNAVQPGRRIAALTKAGGCTTPIAFMTPHR